MANVRSKDQTVITISMSRQLLSAVDDQCVMTRRARAELIRSAIADYLQLPPEITEAPMRLRSPVLNESPGSAKTPPVQSPVNYKDSLKRKRKKP